MKVSIQGIKGSFHHMVANHYFDSFELNECLTFESLVKSVVNNESEYGIMAIENSIAGSILPNYALIDEYNLSIIGEPNINIEEIAVEHLYDTSELKTIRDLDLRKKTGCNVIGYKNEKGEYLINPEAELKLAANSKVIVLGRPEQIQKLNSLYNIDLD